ncbi:MAG: phosphoglycerate mutase (2,3-diphosphoglycerate-independent) [Candidatus Hydrogenedentes bacterium CG1_02_42_14]|nr:MAG: phosphoglycerate mutase (2,3-diphosphoglycerate-independent) [Candidatus Hydrogenedentes bacterium CG1_02_42_14]
MKHVLLVVMDGIGINPRKDFNAVEMANNPFMKQMWKEEPTTSIITFGEDVGLPAGVMGNSEVGHMNIGAGRVVYQPLTLINKEIREGKFQKKESIVEFLKNTSGTLHLMGLLSTGGVHGELRHVVAILETAKFYGVKKVAVHCFMDGRDMPPKSGIDLIRELEKEIQRIGVGRIATISGRYYAMDRDKRWDRVKLAWSALLLGKAQVASSAVSAIESAYERDDRGDEFIEPVIIGEAMNDRIVDGDSVFFWNFRPDRAREMTRALTEKEFDGFEREVFPTVKYLCMTEYDKTFKLSVVYPPQNLLNVLGNYLSKLGLKQFRTAETEKYAHVTFFFNGGREAPFEGEDRKMISSPKVLTYDMQPEMSAPQVLEAALSAIQSKKYDFILVNFANGDMVGHTGVFSAAVKAVETVDASLQKIIPAQLAGGGVAIVTADHGNCEQMVWYETGKPHTQHTVGLVPLTIFGAGNIELRDGGRLADIAPTILELMGLEAPQEMTGESLIR